ncbi:hypothetical protein AB0K43_08515 [Kitasatospora sp. NPDC049258]|uniref:hypothetical protein n=1 Tax=Kitasatospora sp. NPDC049258 TaxID=3155394 RepID=UPI003442DAEF
MNLDVVAAVFASSTTLAGLAKLARDILIMRQVERLMAGCSSAQRAHLSRDLAAVLRGGAVSSGSAGAQTAPADGEGPAQL